MTGSKNDGVGMDVDDVLTEAIKKHRQGNIDGARSDYRRVLQVAPENPDALHYLGLACFQTGELEAALGYIRDALRYAPEYVDAYNNLGTICQSLGQFDDAENYYRKVISLSPGHAHSHSNLGVVLKCQGRLKEAITSYRKAIALDPNHSQAHLNLGNLLRRDGQADEAIDHFRSAIDSGLDKSDAQHALINTLHHEGHMEAAHKVLADWLEQEPNHPIALHLNASIFDGPIPSRAPDDYVRMTFDRMAKSFDEHLDDLGYRAHTLVIEALNTAVGPDARGLSILDAGCGTGLCGPLIRPMASCLVGIDLSSQMIQRARLTKSYDELIEAELTAFLLGSSEVFDAIICADTLCYFGDLTEVTLAAAAALSPGGRFVFSVEYWADAGSTGYLLNPHGRYSHGQNYIEDVIARSGLELEELTVEALRQESGKQVDGLLVTSRRPASA